MPTPCKCNGIPWPSMFVRKSTSDDRKKWFNANQGSQLGAILDPNSPYLEITADEFLSLFRTLSKAVTNSGNSVDALRIYFGVYGPDSDPDTPDGSANRFMFIFSGAKQSDGGLPLPATDLDIYYHFDPNNGLSSVSKGTFQKWRDGWQKGYLPKFKVDHDPNGNNQDAQGNWTETKSVVYLWKELIGLVGEIECQGAEGVRIYISSYTDGSGPNGSVEMFPKRMTTLFALLDDRGQEIDVEKTRCGQPPMGRPGMLDFDTGSPCPPAVGCPPAG